jgi:hypothetical protein
MGIRIYTKSLNVGSSQLIQNSWSMCSTTEVENQICNIAFPLHWKVLFFLLPKRVNNGGGGGRGGRWVTWAWLQPLWHSCLNAWTTEHTDKKLRLTTLIEKNVRYFTENYKLQCILGRILANKSSCDVRGTLWALPIYNGTYTPANSKQVF